MGALADGFLTLADARKTLNKEIGDVAEVMLLSNPILKDIPYVPCNEKIRHVESIRSSLPAVWYRKANQPIAPSKSLIEEREFSTAHFESKSQIDVAVAKRGGMDRVAYNRWNQAQGHIQAMTNELANLSLYGSPTQDTRKVSGFMDVYSTVNPATSEVAKQVIDAGGTGSDNASILFVHWHPQTIFGIYEEGTQFGIQRQDNGIRQIIGTTEGGQTGTYDGYEELFTCDHGLVFKDFRAASRVANISISNLQGASPVSLIDKMISAHFKVPSQIRALGKGVVYMNSTLYAYMFKQARKEVQSGAGFTFGNYQGEDVLMFLGQPVRQLDSLLNTEARVV